MDALGPCSRGATATAAAAAAATAQNVCASSSWGQLKRNNSQPRQLHAELSCCSSSTATGSIDISEERKEEEEEKEGAWLLVHYILATSREQHACLHGRACKVQACMAS